MSDQLEQLKKLTTIVADTGDIEAIKNYSPQDATTNPSLIYTASQQTSYSHLIQQAIEWAKKQPSTKSCSEWALEKLLITFGCEILKIIPGRVSTEIDARYSFDTKASVEQAERLIAMYQAQGISKDRVLIKLASTWEGIQAAKQLEDKGIHCNMTLIFCLEQAAACADSQATLISPFVGRILDWHKAKGETFEDPSLDPGVLSVKQIYQYYKHNNIQTLVMGASFRHIDQILQLAGCDLLTISPTLLKQLQSSENPADKKIDQIPSSLMPSLKPLQLNESQFRYGLNQNAMASDKLAEGIRQFVKDTLSLKALIESRL